MIHLHSETAKELLSRSAWEHFLQYTYTNEDGEETTPFRELVQHMPGKISTVCATYMPACMAKIHLPSDYFQIIVDVAEIVLNKCMEVTDKHSVHGSAVKFNYDYVDDFAEPETRHSNPADINEMGICNPSKCQ